MNGQLFFAGYAGFCGEVGHRFVGGDEFGAAVGVAAVVERVNADEKIGAFEHFGPRQSIGKKDGVAGRDVGDWDFIFGARLVRHVKIHVGQRGAAEGGEIDIDRAVLRHALRGSDLLSTVQFDHVALAIAEREGIAFKPVGVGNGQRGGGVQSATQQHDSLLFLFFHQFITPMPHS